MTVASAVLPPLIPAQAGIGREKPAAGRPTLLRPGHAEGSKTGPAFGRTSCSGFPPARERAKKAER